MKLLSMFILLVFVVQLNAESDIKVKDFPQVEITLLGNNKKIVCNLDPLVEVYICPNNNNPFLVKKSHWGFSGIGRNSQNNKIETVNIKSVKTKSKTLYEQKMDDGNYDDLKDNDKPRQYYREYAEMALPVTNFFEHYSFLPDNKKKKGSLQYEQIAQSFIQEKKSQFDKADKLSLEKNYQVELADGRKINCHRGKTKSLDKATKTFDSYSGRHTQCGIFKCDSVEVDGTNYEATLLFDSGVGVMSSLGAVYLTHKQAMGPTIKTRRVSSLSEPIPLVDHSYFIDKPDSFWTNDLGTNALPENLMPQKDQYRFFKDQEVINFLNYSKHICKDNEKVLKNLMIAKDGLMQKLSEAELAHFIELVGNDILTGKYIDQATAAKLGCFNNGVYIAKKSYKKFSEIKKKFEPNKKLQTVSIEMANQLFKEAAKMDDLVFNYKQDGCYARAHLMAKRFEKKGISVDKVWLKGDLYLPNSMPEIKWNFHVAPIVYVEDKNGEIKKMVIDPTLFKQPVTIEEWDKKIAKKTIRGSVSTAFPFPSNISFYERSALAISNSNVYMPNDTINFSEEDKMELATTTLQNYKQLDI